MRSGVVVGMGSNPISKHFFVFQDFSDDFLFSVYLVNLAPDIIISKVSQTCQNILIFK